MSPRDTRLSDGVVYVMDVWLMLATLAMAELFAAHAVRGARRVATRQRS